MTINGEIILQNHKEEKCMSNIIEKLIITNKTMQAIY